MHVFCVESFAHTEYQSDRSRRGDSAEPPPPPHYGDAYCVQCRHCPVLRPAPVLRGCVWHVFCRVRNNSPSGVPATHVIRKLCPVNPLAAGKSVGTAASFSHVVCQLWRVGRVDQRQYVPSCPQCPAPHSVPVTVWRRCSVASGTPAGVPLSSAM